MAGIGRDRQGETDEAVATELQRDRCQHASNDRRGNPDRFLYVDPLAAAVVIDPSMVTKSTVASSSVALAPGITRGMTLVDPSGRLGTPKITFVEEVDTKRVDKLYAVSVAYQPNKPTN